MLLVTSYYIPCCSWYLATYRWTSIVATYVAGKRENRKGEKDKSNHVQINWTWVLRRKRKSGMSLYVCVWIWAGVCLAIMHALYSSALDPREKGKRLICFIIVGRLVVAGTHYSDCTHDDDDEPRGCCWFESAAAAASMNHETKIFLWRTDGRMLLSCSLIDSIMWG